MCESRWSWPPVPVHDDFALPGWAFHFPPSRPPPRHAQTWGGADSSFLPGAWEACSCDMSAYKQEKDAGGAAINLRSDQTKERRRTSSSMRFSGPSPAAPLALLNSAAGGCLLRGFFSPCQNPFEPPRLLRCRDRRDENKWGPGPGGDRGARVPPHVTSAIADAG